MSAKRKTQKIPFTQEIVDSLLEQLEEQGIDTSSVQIVLKSTDEKTDENNEEQEPVKQKPIRRVTEELNSRQWDFEIFNDTTAMIPGLVCYTISAIKPTQKIPYVTYKPSARVIAEVHDSGVNQGTVFVTYEHKIVNMLDLPKQTQVISETEIMYSPLTKAHAEYICKLLNLQSKQMYKKALLQQKMLNQKQK